MLTLDDREALARGVLAALSDVPPEAVRLLAGALWYADGPLGKFAHAFDSYADELADPSPDGELATLQMAYALRVVARHPRCDELLERLKTADVAPWPQLAAALTEVKERNA